MSRIQNLLPSTYNVNRRPPGAFPETKTIVFVKCLIHRISQINLNDMSYNLLWNLRFKWNEPRILHNYTTTIKGGEEIATFIWTPLVYIKNHKYTDISELIRKSIYYQIKPNKDIIQDIRMNTVFSCQLFLGRFPFDRQTCHIVLRSWREQEHSLIFRAENEVVVLTKSADLPEYYIENISCSSGVYSRENSQNYSFFDIALEFKRKLSRNFIINYFPSTLMVIISWIPFGIDISHTETRIIMGITTILTTITSTTSSIGDLAKVGYLTLLDIWNIVTLIFVTAAFLETSVNYCIFQQRKDFKTRHGNIIGWLCASIGDIDKFCTVNFVVFYFIFNVIYWSACLYSM